MILFDFILYVSGSVLFVSFVGYFYADHKKGQIRKETIYSQDFFIVVSVANYIMLFTMRKHISKFINVVH
jgi:hypothetical protein